MNITPEYKFINGCHMTQEQCDAYNQISEEIEWKENAGKNVEFLKDCRHKMIANLKKDIKQKWQNNYNKIMES